MASNLPYIPDDERDYEAIDKTGELQRHYQDLMAEENAATTKNIGNAMGEAIGNAPANYMQGAKYKTGQQEAGQRMEHAESEEGRQQGRYGMEQAREERDVGRYGLEKQQMEGTIQDQARERGRKTRQIAPSEVGKTGIAYRPGMTYEDLQGGLTDQQNAMGIASSRSNIGFQNAEMSRFAEESRNSRQDRLVAQYEKELKGAMSVPDEQTRASAIAEVDNKYHRIAQDSHGLIDDTALGATHNAVSRTVAAENAQTQFAAGTRVENTLDYQNRVAPNMQHIEQEMAALKGMELNAVESEQGSALGGNVEYTTAAIKAREAAAQKAMMIGDAPMAAQISGTIGDPRESVADRIRTVKNQAAAKVKEEFYSFYNRLPNIYRQSPQIQNLKEEVDGYQSGDDANLKTLLQVGTQPAPPPGIKQTYHKTNGGDPLGLRPGGGR